MGSRSNSDDEMRTFKAFKHPMKRVEVPLKQRADKTYEPARKVRENKPTDSRGKVKVEDASALARAGQMKMRKRALAEVHNTNLKMLEGRLANSKPRSSGRELEVRGDKKRFKPRKPTAEEGEE